MKKLLFTVMALSFIISNLSAQDNNGWYFKGSLQGNYEQTDNYRHDKVWDIGIGVGIHKMLGKKFSIGIDFSYISFGATHETWRYLGPELNFAYFGRIAENFYYIPEVAVGILIDVTTGSSNKTGYAAGISPFGLEYRPCENLGLRLNIVNVSYLGIYSNAVFGITWNPTLSVCYRF